MKRVFSLVLSAALLLLCIGTALADTAGAARTIVLTGSGAEFNCEGVRAEGSLITITEPGEYIIKGKLTDGRIVIDAGYSEEKTSVTLSGVSLTCLSGPAIYVAQAEKVKLYMEEGTENIITSGTEEMLASFEKSNSGAAIYAEDDLDLKGPGVLFVYGYINNGITCKDDLDLDGGTVIIFAANNGIKGSESIEINDGSLSVNCGNDALKTTSTKPGKGYVEIDGGVCLLQAGGNGISAETDVVVYGGETVIESEKTPVKAGGTVTVNGGSLMGNGEAL